MIPFTNEPPTNQNFYDEDAEGGRSSIVKNSPKILWLSSQFRIEVTPKQVSERLYHVMFMYRNDSPLRLINEEFRSSKKHAGSGAV